MRDFLFTCFELFEVWCIALYIAIVFGVCMIPTTIIGNFFKKRYLRNRIIEGFKELSANFLKVYGYSDFINKLVSISDYVSSLDRQCNAPFFYFCEIKKNFKQETYVVRNQGRIIHELTISKRCALYLKKSLARHQFYLEIKTKKNKE